MRGFQAELGNEFVVTSNMRQIESRKLTYWSSNVAVAIQTALGKVKVNRI